MSRLVERLLRTRKPIDHGGLLLAAAVYVLSAVFGWASVGALIVLWVRP